MQRHLYSRSQLGRKFKESSITPLTFCKTVIGINTTTKIVNSQKKIYVFLDNHFNFGGIHFRRRETRHRRNSVGENTDWYEPTFATHGLTANTAKSDLNCKYYKEHQCKLITKGDPENWERGGRDTFQLYKYYLFYYNSLKIMQIFTEKGVAEVHLADP